MSVVSDSSSFKSDGCLASAALARASAWSFPSFQKRSCGDIETSSTDWWGLTCETSETCFNPG
eukprot:1173568-Pyramimonas_sp.AAC.2